MMTTLAAIYARIPRMNCKGLCTRYCGVIGLTGTERALIEATHEIPVVTTTDTLTCPLLVEGRCSAYEVRPAICRIWGTIRARTSMMHCPHGCRPKRWLSDAEARAILDAIRAISPDLRALHADLDAELRAKNAVLAPGGLKPLDDPRAIR